MKRAAVVSFATAIGATPALADCPQASDMHGDGARGIRITFANDGFVEARAEPLLGDGGVRVDFVWDPNSWGQALFIARGIFVSELYFLEPVDSIALDAPPISFTFVPSVETFSEPEPDMEWRVEVSQTGGRHDRTIEATYRWGQAGSVEIGDCTYASLPLFHSQDSWTGERKETDYVYLPELGFIFLQSQRLGDQMQLELTPVGIAISPG